MLLHASCIAIDGTAVLLRGPSGSGKSDLALRLIDGGAALVADDQVVLGVADGHLVARAPDRLAGLLEVRGVGIVRCDPVESAPVALVLDMAPGGPLERVPEPDQCDLLGLSVRRFDLDPFEASAPAKVRILLRDARDNSCRSLLES